MADLWPSTLPQAFEEPGFSRAHVDTALRTPPDVGPELVRLRATAAPAIVAGTMMLTATQKTTLTDFWKTHRAVRFQWVDEQGATRYYLFRRPPAFTPWSIYYKVRLELTEYLTETGNA